MVTLTGSHNSGDTFSIGDTTVTYTAVDPDANMVTDSFTITIEGKYANMNISRIVTDALNPRHNW